VPASVKTDEEVLPNLAGVSRHLELLALARRKRQEQQKVEDKVSVPLERAESPNQVDVPNQK
jgi:hypothetical protein